MINPFLVRGTSQMLIQTRQPAESPIAEIAPVERPVPRCWGGDVRGCGTRVVPANAFGREYTAGVDFSAVLVYLGAVDVGGAAAGFQVQANAG